jgi:hypothetical protein
VEPKTEASGERVEVMEKKVGAWVAKDQTRRAHMHAHAARMVSISVEPATSVSQSALDRRASSLTISRPQLQSAPGVSSTAGLEAIRHLA